MIALTNIIEIATLENVHTKDGRKLLPTDLGIIKNAAIVFDSNEILWVGKSDELPETYSKATRIDCGDKVIVPEVVDCHTHLVFGGNRSHEYSMRLNGADYQEIAKAGGGILNTMNATNAASKEELFKTACERIERIHSYGVGTIEIKSGYGLNFEKEYEISHLIDDLKKKFSGRVQIKNTFMAAHAIPSGKTSADYINNIVIPLMEKLNHEGVIDAVDIFHEKGYFSSEDVKILFKAATKSGLKVKSHADEFVDNKGAILAAKHSAISTDHLLMTSDDGIEALANSKTVATLLPGTGYFLGKPQANARKFLDNGVKVAIGSDYNPGSCHCDNVIMLASLAAPNYGMNMAELWAAITYNAASALDINDQGALIPGMKPRFSAFRANSIDEITYNWGRNLSIPLQ